MQAVRACTKWLHQGLHRHPGRSAPALSPGRPLRAGKCGEGKGLHDKKAQIPQSFLIFIHMHRDAGALTFYTPHPSQGPGPPVLVVPHCPIPRPCPPPLPVQPLRSPSAAPVGRCEASGGEKSQQYAGPWWSLQACRGTFKPSPGKPHNDWPQKKKGWGNAEGLLP